MPTSEMLAVTATLSASVLPSPAVATLGLNVADTDLGITYLDVSVGWDDGSAPEVYKLVPNPYVVTLRHAYHTGAYGIVVAAANHRAPRPDKVLTRLAFQVTAPVGQTPATTAATAALRGPVLPGSEGWDWDMGSDSAVLVSDLRLLLSTRRGERLMDPNFGTNLAALVFEPNDGVVEELARQDVTQATATYVPAVSLRAVTAQRMTDRSLSMSFEFTSLLNRSPLVLNLSLPNAA